ncbi:hypothetical protein [Empedobacter falsenii]
MNETKYFIENLLEKVSDIKDGIFIPNEVELKLSEISNFNFKVGQELSKIEQVVLTKKNHINDEVIRKEEYRVKLIKFSLENDSISFYPIALKNYLKNI